MIIQLLHYGGWRVRLAPQEPRGQETSDNCPCHPHKSPERHYFTQCLNMSVSIIGPSLLTSGSHQQAAGKKLLTSCHRKKSGLSEKKTFHHREEIAIHNFTFSPSAWLALANKSLLRDNNWLRTRRNRTRGAGDKNPSNTQPANHCRWNSIDKMNNKGGR